MDNDGNKTTKKAPLFRPICLLFQLRGRRLWRLSFCSWMALLRSQQAIEIASDSDPVSLRHAAHP